MLGRYAFALCKLRDVTRCASLHGLLWRCALRVARRPCVARGVVARRDVVRRVVARRGVAARGASRCVAWRRDATPPDTVR